MTHTHKKNRMTQTYIYDDTEYIQILRKRYFDKIRQKSDNEKRARGIISKLPALLNIHSFALQDNI